ncbi:MAG: hypothetical protein ACLUS6_11620 [Dysosmobacter sp.]
MKRLFAAILCLCLLAGCGRTDSTGNTCRAEEGSGESMVSDTMGGSGEKAVSAGETFRIIQEQPESCCWLRQMVTRRMCIPCP